jgi:hypothetical protein
MHTLIAEKRCMHRCRERTPVDIEPGARNRRGCDAIIPNGILVRPVIIVSRRLADASPYVQVMFTLPICRQP